MLNILLANKNNINLNDESFMKKKTKLYDTLLFFQSNNRNLHSKKKMTKLS